MPADTRTPTPVKLKAPDSSQVLDHLVRMINRADDFVLGFVKCNHPSQQKKLRREFLARLSHKRAFEVELDKPLVSLLDELTARWDAKNPPDVVCVYGLEKSINKLQEAAPVLGRLNNDRDLLRRAIPVPLLIWLPDFALDFIARGAPDFWAWRSGVYEFTTERALWQQESIHHAATNDVLTISSLSQQEKSDEIAHLKELLRTAQNLPRQGKREKFLIVSIMDQLGLIYLSLGRWEEATAVHQKNLQALTVLDDKSFITITLHRLAILAQNRGDFAESERLYRQSLGMAEDLGDKNGIAGALHQLAILMQGQSDLTGAERLYQKSLSMAEAMGNRRGTAGTLHNLAVLEHERGELANAERLYRQGLSIGRELGDKQGVASDLHQLAMLAQDRGDFTEAESLYQQSLSIKEGLGYKNGIALTNGQLGLLHQQQGQLKVALEYHLLAWLTFCEMHSPDLRVARQYIQELQEQVGEEQFDDWLAEAFGARTGEIKAKLAANDCADKVSG